MWDFVQKCELKFYAQIFALVEKIFTQKPNPKT